MVENNRFHFELVSPAKKLMEEPAFQVVIPGETGYVGVRKGHASLVLSVRPGVVEILKTKDSQPEKFFIAGGFADITADNCTLLAEETMSLNELDKDLLVQQQKDLKEDVQSAKDDIERARYTRKLTVVEAKLHALK
tara:strand:+ start:538 stop:948 length:411 start_codon:yes stop_codon:yes gene_type:complete